VTPEIWLCLFRHGPLYIYIFLHTFPTAMKRTRTWAEQRSMSTYGSQSCFIPPLLSTLFPTIPCNISAQCFQISPSVARMQRHNAATGRSEFFQYHRTYTHLTFQKSGGDMQESPGVHATVRYPICRLARSDQPQEASKQKRRGGGSRGRETAGGGRRLQ
jgi:hypothetical protein